MASFIFVSGELILLLIISFISYSAKIPDEASVIAVTMWFVYILKFADNFFYTGCTSDLDDRLNRHFKGENTYTKDRLPVTLIYYSGLQDKITELVNSDKMDAIFEIRELHEEMRILVKLRKDYYEKQID